MVIQFNAEFDLEITYARPYGTDIKEKMDAANWKYKEVTMPGIKTHRTFQIYMSKGVASYVDFCRDIDNGKVL